MAYDYWADYERHFKAFQRDHGTVTRALGELPIQKTRFDNGMKGKQPIQRNRAKSDFLRYLSTVRKAIDIAENQGRNALRKLNTVIRNRGNFPQSRTHFSNLNKAINALRKQRQVVQRTRSSAVRRH